MVRKPLGHKTVDPVPFHLSNIGMTSRYRHCPKCKALRKATKQLTLSRLPDVLMIHLKRFSFDGPFNDKLETMVDFPIQ